MVERRLYRIVERHAHRRSIGLRGRCGPRRSLGLSLPARHTLRGLTEKLVETCVAHLGAGRAGASGQQESEIPRQIDAVRVMTFL